MIRVAENIEFRISPSVNDVGRRSADQRRAAKPLKDKADKAEAEVTRLSAQLAEMDSRLATASAAEAAGLSQDRGRAAAALRKAEENWLSAQEGYDAAMAGN